MTPREIMQFNELMNIGAVDRALTIKGEFAKEIAALKTANDEWDKRGKMDARLKDLAAQTQAFKKETEEFDKSVKEHFEAVDKLKAREAKLSERETAMAAKEAATIKGAADLASAKDKHDAQVKADTESIDKTRAELALQLADLADQRREVESREKTVNEKLAALKKAMAG